MPNDHLSKSIVVYPKELSALPQGKRIVLVGGVFDIFHYGHLAFLKEAKSRGDYLIIALEGDDFIRKYKKREPVHTQLQRAEILTHLDVVDLVILLPEMRGYEDYLALVRIVHPQVIATTAGESHKSEKLKQAQRVGAEFVEVTARIQGYSSTKLMQYLGCADSQRCK